MFFGHLPGGYLALKALFPKISKPAFAAGLLASILPDIDLFWFYFVSDRHVVHHEYITHRPILWVSIALVGYVLSKRDPRAAIVMGFGAGGTVHMLLDSIVGSINWLWPFGSFGGPLVHVTARHDHWIMNFFTHWTILNEVALCVLALIVLWRTRGGKKG